ncbi:2,3-bisphosphoglycerate-independent phosphoglycerate mutase [Tanacetum coccineum]
MDGDAVITVNFRADRMTMLAQALEYEKFDKFDRVCYDGELKLPNHYLVFPPLIERTSGEYLIKYISVHPFQSSVDTPFSFGNGRKKW